MFVHLTRTRPIYLLPPKKFSLPLFLTTNGSVLCYVLQPSPGRLGCDSISGRAWGWWTPPLIGWGSSTYSPNKHTVRPTPHWGGRLTSICGIMHGGEGGGRGHASATPYLGVFNQTNPRGWIVILIPRCDKTLRLTTTYVGMQWRIQDFKKEVSEMARANFKIILIFISLSRTPGPVMTTRPKATFRNTDIKQASPKEWYFVLLYGYEY